MSNFFKKAKANETPKNSKKAEKLVIKMDETYFISLGYSKKDAKQAATEFELSVKEWAKNKEEMDNLKAQCDLIESDAKQKAKEAYINLYEAKNRKPDNFCVLTANDEAQFQFIVSDKYLKIDDQRADELKETFGDDIVEEFTEFKFDPELLSKHEDKISAAFEALDIPQEDKDKLIKATTTRRIKKGTIDVVTDFGKPSEVIPAIQPIVSVKDVKKN